MSGVVCGCGEGLGEGWEDGLSIDVFILMGMFGVYEYRMWVILKKVSGLGWIGLEHVDDDLGILLL